MIQAILYEYECVYEETTDPIHPQTIILIRVMLYI